jgi:N-acetylmuramoyl-L-alanine amidase
VKLCIDPGHGFANLRPGVYDEGASSGAYVEADIVLAWALTLKFVCEQASISVFLTRDDDRDATPVGGRDDRAELAGCTHFISLHCNEANGKASGCETFYRDSADKRLAAMAQAAILAATGGKNRGIKSEADSQHRRLAIFDFDGPACLVELEFLDGPNRACLLKRDTRLAFARAFIASLTATTPRTEL